MEIGIEALILDLDLLNENKFIPNVTIGLQDVIGTWNLFC